MSRVPQEPLDALNLAAAATVVEREFRLAEFARLVDRLAAPEGAAEVRMAFRSAAGVPTGELRVHALAMLTCQRCLGPMRRTLESTAQLAFVAREDAPVPADHEAIAGDPRRVNLMALVEDELLLSLPLIAVHGADEECMAPGLQAARDTSSGPPAKEMRRPFAGLKELLKH